MREHQCAARARQFLQVHVVTRHDLATAPLPQEGSQLGVGIERCREVFRHDPALAVLGDVLRLEDQFEFADQLALALKLRPLHPQIHHIHAHALIDPGRMLDEVAALVTLQNQSVCTRCHLRIYHNAYLLVCFWLNPEGNSPRRNLKKVSAVTVASQRPSRSR